MFPDSVGRGEEPVFSVAELASPHEAFAPESVPMDVPVAVHASLESERGRTSSLPVARGAGSGPVPSLQGVAGLLVVEAFRANRLPLIRRVAAVTSFSELGPVTVGVAGRAVIVFQADIPGIRSGLSLAIPCIDRRVALPAGNPNVFTFEGIAGAIVREEKGRPP